MKLSHLTEPPLEFGGAMRHVNIRFGLMDYGPFDAGMEGAPSRERGKDMASDYQHDDPVQAFAERRGITFRERMAEIIRKVPEKVRGLLDGLHTLAAETANSVRQMANQKELADPELELRRARTKALVRHARAVDNIFAAQDAGERWSTAQTRELNAARDAFEEVRSHGWRDAEAAYKKNPELAREAGSGQVRRAVQALQLETELRTDPQRRADRFVARWHELKRSSERQYREADMSGYKATRSAMGDMAKSLQRDPQLESILASRKRELGIGYDTGRRLGAELAFTHGIDLGRGRGIGI